MNPVIMEARPTVPQCIALIITTATCHDTSTLSIMTLHTNTCSYKNCDFLTYQPSPPQVLSAFKHSPPCPAPYRGPFTGFCTKHEVLCNSGNNNPIQQHWLLVTVTGYPKIIVTLVQGTHPSHKRPPSTSLVHLQRSGLKREKLTESIILPIFIVAH